MIILKINEIPIGGSVGLQNKISKAWSITATKIANETKAIVMYKGCILEEYLITSSYPDLQQPDKIAFDLVPIQNSLLKGRQVVEYPTSNPCTITNKLTIIV